MSPSLEALAEARFDAERRDAARAYQPPAIADLDEPPDAEPFRQRAVRTAPEPLTRPLPPPSAYPVDALGPVLAPAANAIRRVVQSPMALCGQSVLAAASLCTQRLADVEIDGRRYPLSLWHVTIAASGERKSATDGPALAAVREHERERMREHRLALTEHDVALRQWQRNQRSKDADPCEPEPEPPLVPLLTTAEPTLEGLHKLLLAGEGALGLFSDEGGAFIGGHAMSRDHQLKTVAGLSGLWDRGEADRVRAGDGAAKLYGKRLALHLLMQPVAAERVLGDPVLLGQGFLARCLIAWPESTAGTRTYVPANLDGDPAVMAYRDALSRVLATSLTLAPGSRNEIEPRVLRNLWTIRRDMMTSDSGTSLRHVEAADLR